MINCHVFLCLRADSVVTSICEVSLGWLQPGGVNIPLIFTLKDSVDLIFYTYLILMVVKRQFISFQHFFFTPHHF